MQGVPAVLVNTPGFRTSVEKKSDNLCSVVSRSDAQRCLLARCLAVDIDVCRRHSSQYLLNNERVSRESCEVQREPSIYADRYKDRCTLDEKPVYGCCISVHARQVNGCQTPSIMMMYHRRSLGDLFEIKLRGRQRYMQ